MICFDYMTTVTEKDVEKSALQLEKVIQQAKRRLFEFETLANARAIQSGKFLEFKSVKDLFKNLKRVK